MRGGAGRAVRPGGYSFPAGETVGYWDDAARWTNDNQEHILPPHWSDPFLAESGTLYVTNTQPAATADNANPWLYAFWLRTPQTNPNPGVLHLTTNAHLKAWELGCASSSEEAQFGIIQIDAGAYAEVGSLEVGRSGSGIVTNQGTIRHSAEIWIGRNTGSSGRLVHCDGATMKNTNPKDLYVGQQGHGELLVRDATFDWYWWSDSGFREAAPSWSASRPPAA